MGPHSTSSSPPAAAGWYDDPEGSGSYRFWDGSRWTDAVSSAIPPAITHDPAQAAQTWALAAHLSALLSLFIGLPFIGPLVVYLARRNDPFVRRHAAEALNFNLSISLYAIVLGLITVILIIVVVGLLLLPLFLALFAAWLVLIVLAATKASRGEEYRYPLTIRFVS